MFGQSTSTPTFPSFEWQTQGQVLPAIMRQSTPIWDSIDAEVSSLTDDQKISMGNDTEYAQLNAQVAQLVQNHLMKQVKPFIENSAEGKQLLEQLLTCTRRVKAAVITADRAELEEFRKWKAKQKK